MDYVWLVFGAAGVILLLAHLQHKREVSRRNAHALFRHRTRVPVEKLYEQYHSDTGLPKRTVINVYEGFSAAAGIDVGLLRPEDSLVDLAAAAGVRPSVFLAEVTEALKNVGEAVATGDVRRIETIDDYLHLAVILEPRVNSATS